jgi:hypothetical protein
MMRQRRTKERKARRKKKERLARKKQKIKNQNGETKQNT